MEQKNQIEQGKHPFLAQRVQDLVHTGDGKLAAASLVEFLVVDDSPNASRLRRDDHQQARLRRGRVLDQPCREVPVQSGVNFLGQDGVDALGPGSDRCATLRGRNLEKHQGEGTKIRLGLGENVSRIADKITQLFDG